MNHAWDAPFASSAVPVLPAIWTGLPATVRPVPPVTTPRMYCARVRAKSGCRTVVRARREDCFHR